MLIHHIISDASKSVRRRNRVFVPGVVSAGKPNDYINMFLEEMKQWLRSQLSLDVVSSEELQKRLTYITKLKNDRYYWCFPTEPVTEAKIHDIIDFVHEKIGDAYELTTREERNKSMQALFKDLNDHTVNGFEFGKNYLAYLLYISKVAGADLVTSKEFKGKSFQAGKLHLLLVKATDPVLKLYSQDIKMTEKRLEQAAERAAAERNNVRAIGQNAQLLLERSASPLRASTNASGVAAAASDESPYVIDEGTVETFTMSEAIYTFPLTDRLGTTWSISKKYSDFERLHDSIEEVYMSRDGIDTLEMPEKFTNLRFPNAEDHSAMCRKLQLYLKDVLDGAVDADTKSKNLIAEFISVKHLALGARTRCRSAENIPNYFVDLMSVFTEALTIAHYGTRKEATAEEKAMSDFRSNWGHDGVFMILRAHGYLQRMATILGWTLELNHYFVSMFGNLVSFSKLPIREMILTQKDVMNAFLGVSDQLYSLACDLNAQNKYKWHKNLHVAEAELQRTRFHLTKAVETISRIEHEHLDKDVQMRRLMDVAARFSPFMSKVGSSLPSIQRELGLPAHPSPDVSELNSLIPNADESFAKQGAGVLQLEASTSSRWASDRYTAQDGKVTELEGDNDMKADGYAPRRNMTIGDNESKPNQYTSSRPPDRPENREENALNNNTPSEVCIVS